MRTPSKIANLAMAVVITAGCVAVSEPVSAFSRPQQVTIPYSDEDLATATGRVNLDRRIRRAAHSVCETYTGDRLGDAACVHEVSEQAQREVNARRENASRDQIAAR